ncbi:MAG: glycogen/starch/alpha-glucan phosphorylase [Deltaproteobacteria bacterium]|nr:glycogen/starch/alpha-glucan phosphorylase [Deltaproteobacteria bacterium]
MTAKGQGKKKGQAAEKVRTSSTEGALKRAFADNLFYVQGRSGFIATVNDLYMALSYTVRDRMLNRYIQTIHQYIRNVTGNKGLKTVAYLSAEFLLGPHLGNNLVNLSIVDEVRNALAELDFDLDVLLNAEGEPGLGNGGLGRLAACYLDSLSTLEVPAVGYGIRYEFGIFDQVIRDGWQAEVTDKWLYLGNPWEIRRPEIAYTVHLGGRTEAFSDDKGGFKVRWIPHQAVRGIAYDTPILGYRVATCNTLRLWTSEAVESFDFQAFNVGDYYGAVEEKVASETITKVLYPNDEPEIGRKLRLIQQYFFVSCSLQDMIRLTLVSNRAIEEFPERFAIQLNDTHPSIAVAELMRLLVDEHDMDWDTAWKITTQTMGYTNHTLLPEALEKWSVSLFENILPRHLEIIYEINRRFLDDVRLRYPQDEDRLRRMSIIDEEGGRYVRMAHLACVGSHAVNGVAELHSELLKNLVMRDFYELWPEKFTNVTNGVTPRRWMVLANPHMTGLISDKIGDGWITDLQKLKELEPFIDDRAFLDNWRLIKRKSKERLALAIKDRTGVLVDPESLFDVQVKRIHEYKRQHLNVLHIITLYQRIKRDPSLDIIPRTFIFGGKAAPGYFMAKLIIKLINSVAEVINNDPDVKDRLKVVFFPDFNVKNGQLIYPAADLSEQISTAGKEASGTGNMKFAMNGAVTIGTLDGANVEIREEVGPENFFLFGLTTEDVERLRSAGYRPRDFYETDQDLRDAIDLISSGFFSQGDRNLFLPLVSSLLDHDDFMLLADYRSYVECQKRVAETYRNSAAWTGMSILNVARIGKFSSDRSIREYCEKIWNVKPLPVDLSGGPLDDLLEAELQAMTLVKNTGLR